MAAALNKNTTMRSVSFTNWMRFQAKVAPATLSETPVEGAGMTDRALVVVDLQVAPLRPPGYRARLRAHLARDCRAGTQGAALHPSLELPPGRLAVLKGRVQPGLQRLRGPPTRCRRAGGAPGHRSGAAGGRQTAESASSARCSRLSVMERR